MNECKLRRSKKEDPEASVKKLNKLIVCIKVKKILKNNNNPIAKPIANDEK